MASCSVIHSYSLLHKSLIASSFSLQRFKMGDSSYTSRNISLFTVFIQLTNCTSLKELSDGFYCRLLFSFNLFAFFFLKFFFFKKGKMASFIPASTVGGLGLIHSQGTKIPQAALCGQNHEQI